MIHSTCFTTYSTLWTGVQLHFQAQVFPRKEKMGLRINDEFQLVKLQLVKFQLVKFQLVKFQLVPRHIVDFFTWKITFCRLLHRKWLFVNFYIENDFLHGKLLFVDRHIVDESIILTICHNNTLTTICPVNNVAVKNMSFGIFQFDKLKLDKNVCNTGKKQASSASMKM
jgi:hypothetical protein